jgi:hypothetical protein
MRRTKFDLYQTRSPPFGRPKLSKESPARCDPKGGRGVRVYFVLMESDGKKGDRWLRLGDLAAHEVIVVHCPCGRSVEYHKGFLQRRHRLPSSTICSFGCGVRRAIGGAGFRITILDTRTRGDNWWPRLERVVVAAGE